MSGICDTELDEKVITKAMMGNVKDLANWLIYVAAEISAMSKNVGVHWG